MKLNQSLSAFAAVLVVGAVSTALPANATGNLVANGSLDFSGAGAPTQWSFLNPAGEFWVSFDGQASPDGGSYLGIQDLDTFAPRFNVEGITQDIGGLDIGANYTLTFYSMTNHDAVDPAARQDWRVTFGTDTQTGQQTYFTGTGAWVQSTLAFTATSATQALTFVAEYLPGSYPEMLNLDGIVLTKTTSAVPEPSTYALLAGGLVAMGWAAARRRKPGA
jgi:hypothetical protein